MKRDMELVREILIWIEDNVDPLTLSEVKLGGDWYPRIVAEHIRLLEGAGYLRHVSGSLDKVNLSVSGLTWEGHDLLSTIRSKSVWATIKDRVGGELGSYSIDVLKALGIAIAKDQLKIS